ncbi:hypothetical protein PybrP1_012754 [[Pythium] brassicae (nom. inval.)]|nr:hypothetical protein PybrP1_012754 [[Pythium] brassicae (nom. inval.)]
MGKKSKSKQAMQQPTEAAAQQKLAESKQQQKLAESKQQQKPVESKQQQPKKANKPTAEPLEIASVPGFFGHELQPNQKLLWSNEVEEFCLQLNAAALGASVSAGRSTLFVLAKDAKTALCTLTPEHCEQFALPHTFTPLDGEIVFVVEGVNAIHLTGFIEVQDDDEDEDGDHFGEDYDGQYPEGDSEDESMDGDEEMMVFGDQSGSDDDDEGDNDDDDDEEEADDDRFEVIEERVHGDAAPAKAKKEEKKPAAPAAKAAPKENKKPVEKKETPPAKKKETAPAAKKESEAPAAAKKEPSAKTEKKIAEKVAELTSANTNNKKRAAPSESVEVPKKAKSNTREHKGVTIEEHAVGKGQPVAKGRKVSILYKGRLENGKQFDANQNRKKPFSFRHGIGDVIKGMDIGIEGMRAGGKRTILIPSKLGYGKAGAGPSIPGNANLIFDIEML